MHKVQPTKIGSRDMHYTCAIIHRWDWWDHVFLELLVPSWLMLPKLDPTFACVLATFTFTIVDWLTDRPHSMLCIALALAILISEPVEPALPDVLWGLLLSSPPSLFPSVVKCLLRLQNRRGHKQGRHRREANSCSKITKNGTHLRVWFHTF